MNTKPRPEGDNTLSIRTSLVLLSVVAIMLVLALSVAFDSGATGFDGRSLWAMLLGTGVLSWFILSERDRG